MTEMMITNYKGKITCESMQECLQLNLDWLMYRIKPNQSILREKCLRLIIAALNCDAHLMTAMLRNMKTLMSNPTLKEALTFRLIKGWLLLNSDRYNSTSVQQSMAVEMMQVIGLGQTHRTMNISKLSREVLPLLVTIFEGIQGVICELGAEPEVPVDIIVSHTNRSI